VLDSLLNRRIGLFIRKDVLFYRQFSHSMMDYACPVWMFAARIHIRKLQVLQYKCLRIATGAPSYISNRQIHEDLGVPFFGDNVRALIESFDLKLTDAGIPLLQQRGRHLR
jgi:hypothetical protein